MNTTNSINNYYKKIFFHNKVKKRYYSMIYSLKKSKFKNIQIN